MGTVRIPDGADPKKAAEECADKIMEALGNRKDADRTETGADDNDAFRLSIEHAAGSPEVSASIVGKGRDVFNGIAILLEKTALAITGGKPADAATLVEVICEIVKEEILPEGNK